MLIQNIIVSTVTGWFRIKKYTPARLITAAAAAVVTGVLSVFINHNNTAAAIVWGFVMLAALLFPVEFGDELPYPAATAVLLGLTAVVFVLMQNTISPGINQLTALLFVFNVLLLFGLTALIWLISANMKISIVSVTVLSYILAVADHIVVQARSFEIQFSDIKSIGVALNVAGGYSFDLWKETRQGIMMGICFLAFLLGTYFPKSKRCFKHSLCSGISVFLAIICGIVVFTQAYTNVLGITEKYWKFRGSEKNGFWVNIVYSASATRIVEPDGYNYAEAETETALPEEETEPVNGGDVQEAPAKPHVIVIMNETFSDIKSIAGYLGYEMNTTAPLLPFYSSLTNDSPNIVKGSAISSVYGGNTANSEFEFLTGMSMAFLPRSTVPYNFYLNAENTFGIVDCFNSAGYRTVGIHPEDKTNWKRDTVYKYFSFDEVYFRDNFGELDWETDYYRNYVSDKAVYNKITELFEEREPGESLFTFAVTMQNHGGYGGEGFEYTTTLSDYESKRANEYLTSINNSDAALKALIEYFEAEEEEVIILFFGDHQPSIADFGTYFMGITDASDEYGRLAQYVVPYMFWSNRPLSIAPAEVTSLNFLPGFLLDEAGVPKTEFLNYVSRINGEVMALNAFGWLDYSHGFHPLSYGSESVTDSTLQLYSSLQYNALFDRKNKLTSLFKLYADIEKSADETLLEETAAQEELPSA